MAARRRRRAERRDEAGGEDRGGPRPIWSGTISFGLVAVPVNLFSAVRSTGTPLRMLAPDGTPVQRRYVSSQDGRDVPWEELVRGYEVGEDEYVVLTDDELEAVAPRKSRDIDLRRFVPRADLDPFLFERAWILTPAGDSTKPYRLLAEAMQQAQRAGIATFVMRTREYLVAILAHDGILWAETLRFSGEVRTPRDVGLDRVAGQGPTASKREVDAFVRAIRSLGHESIDRDELRDESRRALEERIERKLRAGARLATADAAADDGEDESDAGPDLLERIRSSLRLVRGAADSDGAADGRARAARGGDDLAQLSKDELYARAQAIDLPGRSTMTKRQLVAALERAG